MTSGIPAHDMGSVVVALGADEATARLADALSLSH